MPRVPDELVVALTTFYRELVLPDMQRMETRINARMDDFEGRVNARFENLNGEINGHFDSIYHRF